ncbi:MAG: DUF3884 family protein [Streptococcus sp.]|nr:DUF3884 family protein [Streptococcus sp.]
MGDMMTVGIKNFIRGILSPTSYPVRVYGINQFRLSRRLVFSKKVQHLGKWYITTGNRWLCRTRMPYSEFKREFAKQYDLTDDEFEKLEFTVDYLFFCE